MLFSSGDANIEWMEDNLAAMSPFFAEIFQKIVEGFVCFCEKKVSDNGKRFIKRWTFKGCPNSGKRFLLKVLSCFLADK